MELISSLPRFQEPNLVSALRDTPTEHLLSSAFQGHTQQIPTVLTVRDKQLKNSYVLSISETSVPTNHSLQTTWDIATEFHGTTF
jgi:hypothetical protein